MKRYNIGLIVLLLTFFLGSCVDEDLVDRKKVVEDGLPTTVNLSLKTTEVSNIETKADASVLENINNLYVLIFKTSGEIDGRGYFTENGTGAIEGEDSGTLEEIRLATTTGSHYIFAAANVQETNTKEILSKLRSVNNLNDLEQIETDLAGEPGLETSGSYILMSGFYATSLDNAKSGIKGTAEFDGNGSYTIYLKRALSAFNFAITCPTEGSSFKLYTYQVMNAPKVTSVFSENDLSQKGSNSVFNSIANPNIIDDGEKTTFSFYMMENTNAGNSSVSDAKAREKRDPVDWDPTSGNSGRFTNAPDNSTYIILKGHYKGEETIYGNSQLVDADVTYYIHLGYLPGMSDFTSKRNINYTYNIQVKGIDEIIAEVTGEDYPRADGTVSFGGRTFIVDAHYDACVITLSTSVNFAFEFDLDTEPWISLYLNEDDAEKAQNYPLVANHSKLIKTADALNTKLTELKDQGKEKAFFTCFVNENYGTDSNWRSYVNKGNREFKILPVSGGISNNGSTILSNEGVMISQRPIQTFYSISSAGVAYGAEWINESGAIEYGEGKYLGKVEYQGRKNMITEISSIIDKGDKAWNYINTQDVKAYWACMKRNRDENGNGKIDSDEIKWYLPSLKQSVGMWMGRDILGEARLYTGGKVTAVLRSENHFWTNSAQNSNKIYMWAEEGSSYGEANKDPRQIRCVRNLGNTNESDSYYSYNIGERMFDLSKIEAGARRGNDDKGHELGGENSELTAMNKLYKKFQVAKRDMFEGEKGVAWQFSGNYDYGSYKWIAENNAADKGASPCSKYAEEDIEWDVNFWGTYRTIKSAKDLGKWRLPNQRELALMNGEKLIEGYSYMCRTKFSNPDYRYGYCQDLNGGASYMRLAKKDVIKNFKLRIRCVRDVK